MHTYSPFQLDIPLASPFFKWLVADEHTLGLNDLEVLEPGLYKSLRNIASMEADDFEALETVNRIAVQVW